MTRKSQYEQHRREILEKAKAYREAHPEWEKEKNLSSYRRRRDIRTGWRRPCKLIIKSHHEELKDDPERLTSEFLVEITKCSCKKYKKVDEPD